MWRRLLALLLLAGLAPVPGAADAGQLPGTWSPVDEPAAVVALAPSAPDTLAGQLVAHAEHPDRVGTPIFRGLRYDADAAQWQGEIFALRLDKWLSATLIPSAADAFTVEVETWLFTRRVEWVRVPDPRD